MKKSLFGISFLMMLMVCPAAFASDYAKYDFFLGYSLMKVGEHDGIDDVQRFMQEHVTTGVFGGFDDWKKSGILERGFSTSFTYNFTPILGLEASFRYNNGYVLSSKWKDGNIDRELGFTRTDVAFLVGPRLTFRSNRVAPFVHGLVGISHDRIGLREEFKRGDDSDSDSRGLINNSSFGIAIGGGLDIPVSENISIRAIQADYYLTNHPANLWDVYISGVNDNPLSDGNKRFNNVNLSFGVVFHFGR